MRIIRASLLTAALALLTACAIARAQIETTPVPLTPKPNFSAMMFLTGNWTCSVRSSRRPSAYVTTSTAAISADGYWLVTRTTTHTASWIPRSYMSEDRITYDPSTSRWVDIEYDEEGGYDLSASSGWHGNTIVWNDLSYPHSDATAMDNPTTLTRVSATRTSAYNTFREPGGRTITVRTVCTKH